MSWHICRSVLCLDYLFERNPHHWSTILNRFTYESKFGAYSCIDTYEAWILQKWSQLWTTDSPKIESYQYQILFGYSYPWGIAARVTQAYPKFFKKPKSFSFIFYFGYITKIDKRSKSSGNMNFKCNYIDVHFFYLLF